MKLEKTIHLTKFNMSPLRRQILHSAKIISAIEFSPRNLFNNKNKLTKMDNIELMYQENILDHYKSPRNFGKMVNATVHHHEYNPLCGDEIDMYLVIDENKKVVDVKVYPTGCAISVASASMLSDEVKGKNIEELKTMTKEQILEMLGIPISPVRLKCALLSLDTLKNSVLIFERYVNKK